MARSNSSTINYSVDKEAAERILRSVPYVQGFHFFTPNGNYTGETAISLLTFSKDIKAVDAQTIKYHFQRGDFQKWIETTLGDSELARRIDHLSPQSSEEGLRKELLEVLHQRLEKLQEVIRST